MWSTLFGSKKTITDNTVQPIKKEELKEADLSIGQLKAVVDGIINRQINNETIEAQREFANKCANFLETKTGGTCVSKVRRSSKFCEATVGEYTLKVSTKGRVDINNNLIVCLPNCSCLADEKSYILMSGVFDDFSRGSPSGEWKHLLSYWKHFTSSFRKKGFSNIKLIFCGLNGEQVTFKSSTGTDGSGSDKFTTIMVYLNNKHREKVMFLVDEINKRRLANIILKLCGNEGAVQTKEQAGLRRLLQAFITKLETDKVTSFTDVKLSLYGQGDSSFHISAGEKDNQKEVVGYVDSKGRFHIPEREDTSEGCVIC